MLLNLWMIDCWGDDAGKLFLSLSLCFFSSFGLILFFACIYFLVLIALPTSSSEIKPLWMHTVYLLSLPEYDLRSFSDHLKQGFSDIINCHFLFACFDGFFNLNSCIWNLLMLEISSIWSNTEIRENLCDTVLHMFGFS